jgi:uncharacterized protein YcbK (DUF882 family)
LTADTLFFGAGLCFLFDWTAAQGAAASSGIKASTAHHTSDTFAKRCRRARTKKARELCRKEIKRHASTKRKPRSRKHTRRRAGANHRRRSGQPKQNKVLNVVNLHTGEVLPILGYALPRRKVLERFLRCRWTHKCGRLDLRVFATALKAADHFDVALMEVISGFRHPKFNEMLRKKGRGVVRRSKHTLGKALDFRFPKADLDAVYKYLRALRFGGVGCYRQNGFLHLDSGRVRTWTGK